jgi:hypothetical protein
MPLDVVCPFKSFISKSPYIPERALLSNHSGKDKKMNLVSFHITDFFLHTVALDLH